MTSRRQFLGALGATLAGCGGSGGSDIEIPKADVLRTDLLFGYYGSVRENPWTDPAPITQVEETKDHCNLHWESFWEGDAIALRNMREARLAGMVITVDVSGDLFERASPSQLALRPDARARLDARCRWLLDNGLGPSVRSLFILDEPDIRRHSACGLMPKGAEIMRKVITGLPDLWHARLAINYTSDFCHRELFDDIMFDDYPARSSIFAPGGKYERFVSELRPHQRTAVFAGGYSDHRQDPTPFVNYAHAHKEMFAVLCFLWRDPHGNGFEGISSDPEMRAAYTAAGRAITQRPAP